MPLVKTCAVVHPFCNFRHWVLLTVTLVGKLTHSGTPRLPPRALSVSPGAMHRGAPWGRECCSAAPLLHTFTPRWPGSRCRGPRPRSPAGSRWNLISAVCVNTVVGGFISFVFSCWGLAIVWFLGSLSNWSLIVCWGRCSIFLWKTGRTNLSCGSQHLVGQTLNL